MPEKQKEWLRERSDLFLKNTIRDFIFSFIFAKKLTEQHAIDGIKYHQLESWVGSESSKGTMWILKDNCHRLWKDLEPDEHPQAFLFDWMVGAIFHEAMKLKENVYLVKTYHSSFEKALEMENGRRYQKRCRKFFQNELNDIEKGIERLGCLFDHAAEHLKELIIREKENAILLRFLLENKVLIDQVWENEGGLNGILFRMFPNGLEHAYCAVGEGYLEGCWYIEARNAFEKALDINPDCLQARSGLRLLEKRVSEVASNLAKEYEGYDPAICLQHILKQHIMGEACVPSGLTSSQNERQ